jgi:hypothetical protein
MAGALACAGLGFAASNSRAGHAEGLVDARLDGAAAKLVEKAEPAPTTQPSSGFSGISGAQADDAAIADHDGADRIFQGDDVISARSVSAFSRRTDRFGQPADDSAGGGGHFRLLFESSSSVLDLSGGTSLQGRAIARAIFAFQSSNLAKPAPGPNVSKDDEEFLAFWEGPQSTRSDRSSGGDVRTTSSSPTSASDLSAPTTVLIPLPTAVWSGLSVFGGYGVVAGLRKFRQLLK